MSQKFDPTYMSMSEVLMVMNGQGQGDVLNSSRVRRFRDSGGARFFTDRNKSYNILQFIAWAADRKHTTTAKGPQTYDDVKAAARERSAKLSRAGREIGPLPLITDPDLREACRNNFKLFCESLFPHTFTKAWSKDHLDAIEKVEDAVLRGALFALAMPRGSGKTSIVEIAVIWALVYGHRQFVMLIGSDESSAIDMLDSIKMEFETNDLLYGLFPEICHAIRALEGTTQKAHSQLLDDKRTQIKWKGTEITLPTVEGSDSSGSLISVAGITGGIRGKKRKLATGQAIRPDLVILDDPQTDESAKSVKQNEDRLDIITGAILGLAGPGEKIAGFMPCTVIKPGDMVDTILNKKLYPQWRGQRTRMVVNFPDRMDLWDQYEEIYNESFETWGDFRDATEFYRKNREAMDAGSLVSWEPRFNHDELSALQHAMNLKILDEYAFWAEYQNDPKDRVTEGIKMLTANEICEKMNGLPRRTVPVGCDLITAGVDVQGKALYFVIMGWETNGTCYVIDYGTFPDQGKLYYTLNEITSSYEGQTGDGFEADLFKALKTMVPAIMEKEYIRDDGAVMNVDQMLIDANWEQSKDTIYRYIRSASFGSNVFPSHGRFYGAVSKPMSEGKKKKGEKRGTNWVLSFPANNQSVRYVYFDANFWKTFSHARLNTEMGGKGCMSFWGKDPRPLRMIADHLVSEYYIPVTARERTVNEWKARVAKPENHFFDGVVLCGVGASMRGMTVANDRIAQHKQQQKKKRKMSEEVQKKRRDR